MNTLLKTLVLLGAMTISGAASAATLSLVGTTGVGGAIQTQVVKKNDLGLGLNDTKLDFISGDKKTASNGLSILGTGPFKITYTYLGFEAGNTNYAALMGTTTFINKGMGSSTKGDKAWATQIGSGLIDFSFGTSAPVGAKGLFANKGVADPKSSQYAIGYKILSQTSALVLFDDIASGDRDFDDLGVRIDVSAVPLPAGGILLLSAMGGIAALRRRKAA